MIDLAKYIEVLLLDQDCVILPDLGGFVARNEKAYVLEEGTQFYPPRRTVGFNAKLTVNDGLLVQSLMQSCDTDYSNASRLLEEEINNVKVSLRDGNTWDVGNLGTLEMSAEGTLDFVPAGEGGMASPALFGLDTFVMKPFSVVAASKMKELHLESETDEASEVNGEEQPPHRIQPWAKSLMKYAAFFIGFVVLFFAFSVPVSNVSLPREGGISMANGVFYGFPVENVFKNACNSFHKVTSKAVETPEVKPMEKKAETRPAVVEQTKARSLSQTDTPSTDKDDYYTIVLASKVKESNARILMKQLAKEGFDDADFFVKKKMKRVTYSSYINEGDAYAALSKMRKCSNKFKEAWVLHIHN